MLSNKQSAEVMRVDLDDGHATVKREEKQGLQLVRDTVQAGGATAVGGESFRLIQNNYGFFFYVFCCW